MLAKPLVHYKFSLLSLILALTACGGGGSPGLHCTDRDRDGFGQGCIKGLDCNDNDPIQGSKEICAPADGQDNDCDGEIDEIISPACVCDVNCDSGGAVGVGGTSFNLSDDTNNSVELDSNGFLQLAPRQTAQLPYIWIVNTGEGTVSKFSTQETNANGTFKELARFWSGPHGASNDPSRTTVNTQGDAFVGNRGALANNSAQVNGSTQSVTKISSADCRDQNNNGMVELAECNRAGCIDRNNNGLIETSNCDDGDADNDGCEAANILPWGSDECVIWNQHLYNGGTTYGVLRAMAAQDIPSTDAGSTGYTEYLWVGSWGNSSCNSSGTVWKLNGDSSVTPGKLEYGINDSDTKIILSTSAPAKPYGFAMDGNGQLWISSRCNNVGLGRVDTTRCVSSDSCTDIDVNCNTAGEGTPFDNCIKQKIPAPRYVNTYVAMYGITVDRDQNVWLGSIAPGLFRYTPNGPPVLDGVLFDSNCVNASTNSRWRLACVGDTRGVAADSLGFIYGGGAALGVHILPVSKISEINQRNDLNSTNYLAMPGTEGLTSYGVAVDTAGHIWAMHRGSSNNSSHDDYASVIEPQIPNPRPETADLSNITFQMHTVTGTSYQSAKGLAYPYTYSDMTGVQLRLATNSFGYYTHIFEGCLTNGATNWRSLFFDAYAPAGTRVRWFARGGATRAALADIDFVHLGDYPSDDSPLDLSDFMAQAFLEVRLELVVDGGGFNTPTPVVRYFEPTYQCEQTGI